MAQFKIYGREDFLRSAHAQIGELVHEAAVRTLKLPVDKRFQRFLPLADWQMVAPPDRSERYLIIEVIMFSGRSIDVRKSLLRALMEELRRGLGLEANDVEITILESPRENWGIRGQTGDELALPYQVEI